MTVLAGLGRRVTYRHRPSWFELHPLPEGWRAPEEQAALTAPPPPVGERWQWIVTDGRGEVLAWGILLSDLDNPQRVAREAMAAFLAGRPGQKWGLVCGARRAADPTRIGVVRAG